MLLAQFLSGLTVAKMDCEIRHGLAIELDPNDWPLLARELGVPEDVIGDIASSRKCLSPLEFLKALKARYPNEKLVDLRQKVQRIERNDVVEFIDSSLKEFLGERLDKIPHEKIKGLMKYLEERASPTITKDWRNLAVLYGYKDEEIDYISSMVSCHKKESPTDCLVSYLAKSNPLLPVAEIGLALEKLRLNRASMKLQNEYLTRNAS